VGRNKTPPGSWREQPFRPPIAAGAPGLICTSIGRVFRRYSVAEKRRGEAQLRLNLASTGALHLHPSTQIGGCSVVFVTVHQIEVPIVNARSTGTGERFTGVLDKRVLVDGIGSRRHTETEWAETPRVCQAALHSRWRFSFSGHRMTILCRIISRRELPDQKRAKSELTEAGTLAELNDPIHKRRSGRASNPLMTSTKDGPALCSAAFALA
jgi:hypothetical protein